MNCAKICFAVMMCLGGFALPFASGQVLELPLHDAPQAPERKGSSRLDFLWKAEVVHLGAASWLDGVTTARNLHHPNMAYRANESFLMRYEVTEQGWARCFGNKDATAAVMANAFLNAGVLEISHRLYRHPGIWWKTAAIALVAYKATDSTLAGIHNIRFESQINSNVQHLTGYRGVIVWRSR